MQLNVKFQYTPSFLRYPHFNIPRPILSNVWTIVCCIRTVPCGRGRIWSGSCTAIMALNSYDWDYDFRQPTSWVYASTVIPQVTSHKTLDVETEFLRARNPGPMGPITHKFKDPSWIFSTASQVIPSHPKSSFIPSSRGQWVDKNGNILTGNHSLIFP